MAPLELQLLSVFQAAAGFALAIWKHRPADVFPGTDPFECVEWGTWGPTAQELSYALKRPSDTDLKWRDAVEQAGYSFEVREALTGLYRTYDLQKQVGGTGSCGRGALRQTFGLLHRGLWVLYQALSPDERQEAAPLVHEVGRLWGWGPTFSEGNSPAPRLPPADPGSDGGGATAQPSPTDAEGWGERLVAILNPNDVAIMRIAEDQEMTADQRMRAIHAADNRVVGYDSPRWAKILGITAAAVRSTDWWRHERPRLRGSD
jgi:hypothetical protein